MLLTMRCSCFVFADWRSQPLNNKIATRTIYSIGGMAASVGTQLEPLAN